MAKSPNWTANERAHLSEFYPAIGSRQLRELLPTRTEVAIRRQAARMDLKKCHERLRELGAENVYRRWHKDELVQ